VVALVDPRWRNGGPFVPLQLDFEGGGIVRRGLRLGFRVRV